MEHTQIVGFDAMLEPLVAALNRLAAAQERIAAAEESTAHTTGVLAAFQAGAVKDALQELREQTPV